MEQFLIYLWSISEGIRFLLFIVVITSIVISIGICVGVAMDDYGWDEVKSYVHKGIAVAAVFSILCIATPSKQDLALIFLYPSIKQGTLNVVQSDTTKKMVEVLNGYLDKQLKELK